MSSNIQLFLLLLALFLSHLIDEVDSTQRSLSKIRYHFTPCGSTGFDGPTFDKCETYYQDNSSPIAADGVLFQFDEEDFLGGQGFQIPREDVYNVTIAGAAGGRGLCNIHFGRGRVTNFQLKLTPEYELLVMVGQKGTSPCDTPSGHPLCDNPPTDFESASQCNQTWYLNGDNFSGGGGGGGASMLRARNIESRILSSLPIVIAGGGGGTSAILDYAAVVELIEDLTTEPNIMQPEQSYQYHIDARFFPSTDIREWLDGFRGFRPSLQLSIVAGAGGGWSSLISSSGTDGKAIDQNLNFAEGGLDCGRFRSSLQSFRDVNGGFGGGGGQCGGGGGGGGYTGGAVLGFDTYNIIPGGGGHSFANSTQDLPILSTLRFSFNNEDGYVDIVPANCNCTGYCSVNETGDTFECFCPNDTQLAQDGFDCFNEVNIYVSKLKTIESNGFLLQGLQFLNDSVEIFSINNAITVGPGSACAIVFLDRNRYPVAASSPLRESGVVNMLAHLMVAENYSRIVMSEYTNQFASSVEVTGAVLVSSGNCSLDDSSIVLNISTRVPPLADYDTDIGESIADIAVIASQVLQLQPGTPSPPEPRDTRTRDLVIGLVVAAVVLILILIVVTAFVIWNRLRKTKSKEMSVNQRSAINIVGTESIAYAEVKNENREFKHSYNNYSKLEHRGKDISPHLVKDDGYEVLEYEDKNVVHTVTTTLSVPDIAPLYGIIAPSHDFTNYNRERASSGVANWQYPRNKLIYIRELGEGQFGKVLLMKAQGIAGYNGKIPVAVKTLTSRDPIVISKFMEEADLMRKFSHPNIVSLLGVSSNTEEDDDDDDSAPLMILEYMPYGDLQGFLESHKPDEKGQTCIREKQFHTFACDIALALDFLAENHYIHRDVAARNCLVSTDLHIKLADFGLSREIYEKDYYKIAGKAILPVRWMAPECLIYGIFTTAADVWSYGVVLWEITSYGDAPLDDMEAKDIVEAAQEETLHHSRPEKCPDYLYTLMSKCHTHEASERPTFRDILNMLANEQTQYEEFSTKMTYEVPPDTLA